MMSGLIQIGISNISNEMNANFNFHSKKSKRNVEKNKWIKIYSCQKEDHNKWKIKYVFEKYDDICLDHRLLIHTDQNYNIESMELQFGKKNLIRRKTTEIDFSEHKNRAKINLLVYPVNSFLVEDSMRVVGGDGKVGKISKVGIGGFFSRYHPIAMKPIWDAVHVGECIRIIADNGEQDLILDTFFDLEGFHELTKGELK